MRALAPILLFAAALGACGESNEAEGERETSTLRANAISSNDITAIDAVTGEAANMAADVQIDADLLGETNAAGNEADATDRPRRPARPAARSGSAPEPAAEPAAAEGNSAD